VQAVATSPIANPLTIRAAKSVAVLNVTKKMTALTADRAMAANNTGRLPTKSDRRPNTVIATTEPTT
jgi:hypothetical protein